MDEKPFNESTHPLRDFKYCPKCGSSYFFSKTFKSKLCKNCGFHYYFNPAAAASVFLINNENEILIIKKKLTEAKGSFSLPGGFIDFGETAEEAAVKQVKEKTGIDIKKNELQYLFSFDNEYIFDGFKVWVTDIFYEYKIKDLNEGLIIGEDVQEIKIVNLKEIDLRLFTLKSYNNAIKVYLEKNKN